MVDHATLLLEAIKRGAAKGLNTKPLEQTLLGLVERKVEQRQACEHLGQALSTTVKTDCKTCDGKRTMQVRVYACNLHTRCLPHYKPVELEKWLARKPESDIYKLCHHCPDKT